MSEKISVNINIPGLNTAHSYLVPYNMRISQTYELVVNTLCDEYPGIGAKALSFHGFIQASSGKLLNDSCSLRQLGLSDGDVLIMI